MMTSPSAKRAGSRFIGGLPMKAATSIELGFANTSAGRADLLDFAGHEHRHAIGQRHGLFLVVRDVDGRDAERALQLLQLGARFHAQLGVEIGERLVEQEQARLANDGARQRTALLLAARQLAGLAVEQMVDLDLARGFLHRGLDLGRRQLGHFAAGRRCSRTRSCAGRARSSGTPWRCRGRARRSR